MIKCIYKFQKHYTLSGEEVVVGRSQKMSKSKKNVVDPDHIVNSYGADTARLFMLSDSPPERDLEWSDAGIEGAYKYLNRLWRLVAEFVGSEQGKLLGNASAISSLISDSNLPAKLLAIRKITHKTIKNVTEDLDKFHFNKAVARIRELTNAIADIQINNQQAAAVFIEAIEAAIKLLQPMIPHITEELWAQLGHKQMLVNTPWAIADNELVADDLVTIAIQLNGKLKVAIEMAKDLPKEQMEKIALENEKVKIALEGKAVRKVIIVPNRIVNVVF